MINELYSVYQGLKDVGEDPAIKHNDIASPGMGTTFRVILSEDGTVDNLELLTKEKIKDVWSLGNGNKNQFPAVKFEYPFIPDAHKDYLAWKKENKNADAAGYRSMIKELLDEYTVTLPEITCWPSYWAKIEERKNQIKEQLQKDLEGSFIYELFKRFCKDDSDGLTLLDQVSQKLIDQVITGDKLSLKAIADTLFGNSLDRKGKVKDENRITLLFDCLPQTDIDVFASSRSRVPTLSKALFAMENGSKKTGICAVTGGNECDIIKKEFPSEKLSVVGKTILLTKSDKTSGPTVRRYDKAGADSFPLNALVAGKLASTIIFLTDDDLESKTWKKIPSSIGKSPSLLLAYCKSNFDLAITPAITGGEIEDFDDDYENATATVLELFNTKDCTPDDIVEICEIRVLDKANRKVNYSTSTSISRLSWAANQWVSACKNTPDFKLLAKINKKSKALSPWAIPPIDVIDLTKNKFIREGLASTPVSSISFADTMTLFMSQSDRTRLLALRIIEKLANQVEALFEYCALSKNQWQLPKKNQRVSTKSDKNKLVLKIITLFGVLFYKAGRKKEAYMSSFAYQLGQLCSAMDELHIGYCQSVRNGDIPNTLIGNTTYNVGLQSPVKSLALLASRIKPYKSWAKKVRAENKKIEDKSVIAGLAASVWLESHSADIAKHFSEQAQLVNDTYKAELMLGYLAGRPFNNKKQESQ